MAEMEAGAAAVGAAAGGSSIAATYAARGVTFVRGEGCYLVDERERRYLDCCSNYGVSILGHSDVGLRKAIQEQAGTLTNLHGSFGSPLRERFAARLAGLSGLAKVFFTNSGAESVEAAIKFARLATGRKAILSARMGYHGKTLGALSLTRTLPKYHEPFAPLLGPVAHFSYDDPESLRQALGPDTAAVFLEPIQGEGGVRIPSQGYLAEARRLCDEAGALLVVDEIQTGMGRTGKLFAYEHAGVRPDMVCLAKGLCGGVPAGAVLMTPQVEGKLFPGCHTNTFGGGPLACAAGLATLGAIEERGLLRHAETVGGHFRSLLQGIGSPLVREVRGQGLMLALELKVKASDYAKRAQDLGLLVIPTGSTVLRLLPPLILTRQQAEEAATILAKVLAP